MRLRLILAIRFRLFGMLLVMLWLVALLMRVAMLPRVVFVLRLHRVPRLVALLVRVAVLRLLHGIPRLVAPLCHRLRAALLHLLVLPLILRLEAPRLWRLHIPVRLHGVIDHHQRRPIVVHLAKFCRLARASCLSCNWVLIGGLCCSRMASISARLGRMLMPPGPL